MGVSTTYERSPGLLNEPTSLKGSTSTTTSGSKIKPTVHKKSRPAQHRLPLIKRRPRVVRFDMEANQVQETERIVPESKPALSWTRDERDDILESNQRLAREFRQQQPMSVEQANLAFDRCCEDHNITDDSSDEDDSMGFSDDENEAELEVQDTLANAGCQTIDVPTQVRGLEWGFLPASKKYRRTHVQRVLRWQRCIGTGDNNKARTLSARAIRSSRPSRAMARIFGASDAVSAKDAPVVRRTRCRMLPTWW